MHVQASERSLQRDSCCCKRLRHRDDQWGFTILLHAIMHTSPSDLHILLRLSDLMLFLEVLWGWSLSHLVQSRTSNKWSCTLATFFLCESEGLDKLHPYRTAAVLVDSRTSVWICDVVRLSPQSMHHLRAWNRISVAVMGWSWGFSSSHWLRNWCIPWGLGMENGSSSSGPSVEKVWLWHTMMLMLASGAC